ncbi:GrpB family protein [Ensifer sp. ENS01]|uniref:GrpB family protein n=1 Tax=Ensifer sp. ENS01 TaxID=2769293 RepID=UPI001FED47F4|nr:GrpB family protein [Ensifer sp. ENS01]
MDRELPCTTQPIEICDWSSDWAERFATKAKTIRQVLGDHALRIDHIGSTAIRGLAAKPIIDVQISVADLESLDVLAEKMAAIGYLWRPQNTDLAKRYFRERPGDERTHIHVRRAGSWQPMVAAVSRLHARPCRGTRPIRRAEAGIGKPTSPRPGSLYRGQVGTLVAGHSTRGSVGCGKRLETRSFRCVGRPSAARHSLNPRSVRWPMIGRIR